MLITASVGNDTYNIQTPKLASEGNVLPVTKQLPVDGYTLLEETNKDSEGGVKQHHQHNNKRKKT